MIVYKVNKNQAESCYIWYLWCWLLAYKLKTWRDLSCNWVTLMADNPEISRTPGLRIYRCPTSRFQCGARQQCAYLQIIPSISLYYTV